MNVAIISNFNGIGLQRDAELLAIFLTELGHTHQGFQFDEPLPADLPRFDLAIFLEVVPRNLLEIAPVKWAFLNPEWCKPDVVKLVQRHFDHVFAKTKEAERIFEPLFPGKVWYTGFLTRDQYDPDIKRENGFLHIGGNSSLRGTQAVLDAWKWKKNGKGIDARLLIISTALQDRPDLPNVLIHERFSEEALKRVQNECLFHLYPSGTEGYGHALHEAQSVGAVIMTTDAPPMNELEHVYQIPAIGKSKYNLADVHEVSALDIFNGVNELLEHFDPETTRYQFSLSRKEFLDANEEFKQAFGAHLTVFAGPQIKIVSPPKMRTKSDRPQIAFIGNFKASESTENMVKWALEEGLGYEVEMLQENEINLSAIYSAMDWNDLLLWVRTPNWLNVRDQEMKDLLDALRKRKIPSVSLHLDKFWGIPDREAQIGVHPFWLTDHVFTADGSRDADFAARGVNHHWMKPAVSEVYCHPGQPWDMYRCDVGFVGAKDYHAEYPFRGQLVEFLEKTYGDRFKHITGLRGHGLNDFYASCKVVVGDCIFAGTPHYWSDRVPETCGRYGLMLHPYIEGLDYPMVYYAAQSLPHLHEWIEKCLAFPESVRREVRYSAAAHVLRHDTWTVRMHEILAIVKESQCPSA